MHHIVRSLVVLLLLGAVGLAPPATAAGEDWRLLYAAGDLRDGTGALKSDTPAGTSIDFPVGRFSPDGTLLATPGNSCGDVCGPRESALRIHSTDGPSVPRGAIPNFVATAVAWSPDGSTVAALGEVFTPEDNDVRIYLVPVDGSPVTQVYSDTRLLRISKFAGLSWRATDDTLAFIATEFFDEDGGFARFENTDQVWTVPAAGLATPTRFTGRPACQGCASFPWYRQPTWSPDGTTLAVSVGGPPSDLGDPAPATVGFLTQGALSATPLRSAAVEDQLAWSGDGSMLAYGVHDTSGDGYDETEVIDAGTGVRLQLVAGVVAPFVDWLPCPGGTCPVWQDVFVPPVPTLTIHGRARGEKVVATGEMFRVPVETTVRVTLFRRPRAGSPWRKVAAARVPAVEGLFKKSFARPPGVQCKVTGAYTGTDGQRASDAASFRC